MCHFIHFNNHLRLCEESDLIQHIDYIHLTNSIKDEKESN